MKALQVRNIILGEGIPKICVPVAGRSAEEALRAAREIGETDAEIVEFRADIVSSGEFIQRKESERRYLQRKESERRYLQQKESERQYLLRKEGGAHVGGNSDSAEDEAADENAFLLTIKELVQSVRNCLPEKVLLFTWRTAAEGGSCPQGDARYAELVRDMVLSGCIDLIDIEWKHPDAKSLLTEVKKAGVPVVFSEHHFEGTPDEKMIREALLSMEKEGADIAKIAVMPHTKEDAETLFAAAKSIRGTIGIPYIAISMGELGRESRTRAEEAGSCLTFGSIGSGSAPGQVPVSELRKLLLAFHDDFI